MGDGTDSMLDGAFNGEVPLPVDGSTSDSVPISDFQATSMELPVMSAALIKCERLRYATAALGDDPLTSPFMKHIQIQEGDVSQGASQESAQQSSGHQSFKTKEGFKHYRTSRITSGLDDDAGISAANAERLATEAQRPGAAFLAALSNTDRAKGHVPPAVALGIESRAQQQALEHATAAKGRALKYEQATREAANLKAEKAKAEAAAARVATGVESATAAAAVAAENEIRARRKSLKEAAVRGHLAQVTYVDRMISDVKANRPAVAAAATEAYSEVRGRAAGLAKAAAVEVVHAGIKVSSSPQQPFEPEGVGVRRQALRKFRERPTYKTLGALATRILCS